VNDRWFACRACGVCVDAGYRRAWAELEEPGIVRRREPVDAAAVERADGYWRGAEGSAWLAGLLPAVREFLREHAAHGLTYGDTEDVGLIPPDDPDHPTVREIRPGAPHAPPDPPKT
jgi:hypothetical protein